VEDPQLRVSGGLLQPSSWSADEGFNAAVLFVISWLVLKKG